VELTLVLIIGPRPLTFAQNDACSVCIKFLFGWRMCKKVIATLEIHYFIFEEHVSNRDHPWFFCALTKFGNRFSLSNPKK
jgi:hypothetical protein